MIEEEITLYDIPLEVTAEIEGVEREPYSWGVSRGTDTEVYINSVKVGGQDILILLSDTAIELIGEKIREIAE